MGECVAYAESLRGEEGQFLTPQVAHVFQEAVEDRRPAKAQAGGSGAAEGRPSDAERSLKTIFRKAVGKERPETRRSSGSSDHDSELSAGDDYDGGRGSDFSHHSSDTERSGTGGSSSTTGSSTRRRRRRRRPRKTERSQSSGSINAPTSTSDRQESRQERGKGGDRRGIVQSRSWEKLCQNKSGLRFHPTCGRSSAHSSWQRRMAPLSCLRASLTPNVRWGSV